MANHNDNNEHNENNQLILREQQNRINQLLERNQRLAERYINLYNNNINLIRLLNFFGQLNNQLYFKSAQLVMKNEGNDKNSQIRLLKYKDSLNLEYELQKKHLDILKFLSPILYINIAFDHNLKILNLQF